MTLYGIYGAHNYYYALLSFNLQASCIAVAGILHYFFTGAFAWLFCESIVITLFGWVSRRWGAFLLFLLVGWGKSLVIIIITEILDSKRMSIRMAQIVLHRVLYHVIGVMT